MPWCSGHPSARLEGAAELEEEMQQGEPRVGNGSRSPSEQGHGVLHRSYQRGFTVLLGVNTQQL